MAPWPSLRPEMSLVRLVEIGETSGRDCVGHVADTVATLLFNLFVSFLSASEWLLSVAQARACLSLA